MVDLFLLDSNLNQLYIVDSYESLIWVTRYNDNGDCEIKISANYNILKMFKECTYITREDDDMVCRIEKIELVTDVEEGDYLIVTANDCKKILEQRIVWKQTNFNGKVEDYIRKLINDNIINPTLTSRKINNFTLDTKKNFTETINQQVSYDNLGSKIQELCKTYSWGDKVTINNSKQFVFSLYKGTDRSAYVQFSDDYENLAATNYSEDISDIANTALVAGEGEGVDRITTTVGNETGIDRYELYVDARDVSKSIDYDELTASYPNGMEVTSGDIIYYQVDGVNIAILTKNEEGEVDSVTLTDTIYNDILVSNGEEGLAEHVVTTTFTGEIEPNYTFTYKKDYFLGDIVVIKNHYGIEEDVRITEIMETFDSNGYNIEPSFEYLETGEE